MKLSRFSTYLLGALLLGGCSDDNFFTPSRTEEGVKTFSLYMPGFAISTRAMEDEKINTLRVFFLDDGGNPIGTAQTLSAAAGDITSAGSNCYAITLEVPGNTESVKVYANHSDTNLTTLTEDINEREDVVFFGEADVTISSVNPTITLTRVCAKTTVINKTNDFTLQAIYHHGRATSGMIEPGADTSKPNLPDDVAYAAKANKAEMEDGEAYYHYEAEKGNSFIIIKGTYNNVEGYYKAGYYQYDENQDNAQSNELDILRNHHYVFEIIGINDYGWPDEDAAIAHDPDNRMKILLNDFDESIFNIIACRDYYLGVGKDVEVAGDKEEVEVKIVTSFEKSDAYGDDDVPYKVLVPANSWISQTVTKSSSQVVGINGTTAVEYTLKFTFPKNDKSSDPRPETIRVISGDLTREFTITQDGWDFFRDDNRKVTIYNLPEHNPSGGYDYFKFLDEELNGETKMEMGVSRTDALHFEVYPQSGQLFYYTIPKLEGDEISEIPADANFSVEADGDNWKVTCTNHNDYEMWEDEFVLSNSENHSQISYKVYHAGIFHKLGADSYLMEGPDGNRPSGWFYYEQVKVGDVYMLDRNLGASSNKAYHPAGQSIGRNADARGAYYALYYTPRTNEYKAQIRAEVNAGISAIPPKGYAIPTVSTFKSLNVVSFNAQEGAIGVSADEGLLPRVYIPYAGNMSGDAHVDVNQLDLWSQSLLSGYQGFSSDSQEYGYWFRYFDVTGQKISYKNIRIGNLATGAGVGDVQRGMPVRCMTNVEGDEEEDPIVTTTTYRLYWKSSIKEWIHIWAENMTGITNWDKTNNHGELGKTDPNVSGYYYIEFTDPKNENAKLCYTFHTGDNSSNNRTSTQTIKNLFTYDEGLKRYCAYITEDANGAANPGKPGGNTGYTYRIYFPYDDSNFQGLNIWNDGDIAGNYAVGGTLINTGTYYDCGSEYPGYYYIEYSFSNHNEKKGWNIQRFPDHLKHKYIQPNDFTQVGSYYCYTISDLENNGYSGTPAIYSVILYNGLGTNWQTPKVYLYPERAGGWSGTAMRKMKEADYYVFTWKISDGNAEKVIFNNGSGDQSADLEWEDKYEYRRDDGTWKYKSYKSSDSWVNTPIK